MTVGSQMIVPDKARFNVINIGLLASAGLANFKLALISSAFTPNDATNEIFADISGSELAAANGYPAGGNALAGFTVTLIPAQAISSITHSGAVATVTTGSAHGLTTGQLVTHRDAVDVLYNGTFAVTVVDSTHYTYTMTGTPGANASVVGTYTGPIIVTFTPSVFTASGGSIPAWRHAYVYYVGTLGGKVNPIFARYYGDATRIDIPATTATNTCTTGPGAVGAYEFASI